MDTESVVNPVQDVSVAPHAFQSLSTPKSSVDIATDLVELQKAFLNNAIDDFCDINAVGKADIRDLVKIKEIIALQ